MSKLFVLFPSVVAVTFNINNHYYFQAALFLSTSYTYLLIMKVLGAMLASHSGFVFHNCYGVVSSSSVSHAYLYCLYQFVNNVPQRQTEDLYGNTAKHED